MPLLLLMLFALAGCHRAQPSDVGAMAVRTAGGDAVAKVTDRGYQASPKYLSPATRGTPMRLSP